jgi:hypothetical protein
MRRIALLPVLALVAACGETAMEPSAPADRLSLAPSFSEVAQGLNRKLALDGADYVLFKAEYLTSSESGRLGRTVYFADVGNKRMDSHWVPGDSRRPWGDSGGGITYIIDGTEAATTSGLTDGQTSAAIENAMGTWDAVRCSTLPLVDFGVIPFDLGVTQALVGLGGFLGLAADITHAGWLPGAFFDLVEPGGSAFILAVTFTYSFIDGNGDLTDADSNRRWDTAFAETFYNDDFSWKVGDHFDVETIALHETGHSLSQDHFGKAFRTHRNGRLHFAPWALMNQAYSGIQTTVSGTDEAGHCSIWAAW